MIAKRDLDSWLQLMANCLIYLMTLLFVLILVVFMVLVAGLVWALAHLNPARVFAGRWR